MDWDTEVKEALKCLGYLREQENPNRFSNRVLAMRAGRDFVIEGDTFYDVEHKELITRLTVLQSGVIIPKACACKRIIVTPRFKDSFMFMLQETQEELLKIASEVAFTATEVSNLHHQLEEVITTLQFLQRELAEPAKRDVNYIRQVIQAKIMEPKNNIEVQALATLQTELNIMKSLGK